MNERSFTKDTHMNVATPAKGGIARKALELFVEQGVQGVSVRDVAGAAGCTPSNIYSHWKSFGVLAE